MSNEDDIASLNGGQPVSTTEPNTGGRDFSPLPAGWYPVEIKKAEIRDTKNKKGKFLWLELEVIGEHYAGRRLFPKFNLVNESAKAVEIGQRDLGHLGESVGMATGVKSSASLIGKQLDARVTIKKANGDYPEDNEVTGYGALGKKSSEAQAQAPAPKANAPKAGQGRAWDKPPEGNAATPPPAASSGTAPAASAAAASTAAPAAKSARPWERK